MEQFLLSFFVFHQLMLFMRVGRTFLIEVFIEIIIIHAVVRNNTRMSVMPFARFSRMVNILQNCNTVSQPGN